MCLLISINSGFRENSSSIFSKCIGLIDRLFRISFISSKSSILSTVNRKFEIFVSFSFKNSAKDILITSQLRTALIFNKNVSSANFNIDTINQKTYVFGIAHSGNEKKEIIQEAKQIVDLKELVTSILMTSDLSRQRE